MHDAKVAYDAPYKPVNELLQFASIMTDALRSYRVRSRRMCGDEPHMLDIHTHYACAFTGDNYFRACRGKDNDDQVFTLDGCPADRVIYITSVVVGHSISITWNESNSQCYIGRPVYYCGRYQHEIMRCNGRRDCSIARNLFNQVCHFQHVNFTEIRYICVKGKSTIRTFYDSAFRVYFMTYSCRILSSKNCTY